jgi:hypothetical protein
MKVSFTFGEAAALRAEQDELQSRLRIVAAQPHDAEARAEAREIRERLAAIVDRKIEIAKIALAVLPGRLAAKARRQARPRRVKL